MSWLNFDSAARTQGQVSSRHQWYMVALLISLKGGKSTEDRPTHRSVSASRLLTKEAISCSCLQDLWGPQCSDQTVENRSNQALLVWLIPIFYLAYSQFLIPQTSVQTKRPVRVIRGPNPNSAWAPVKGYRYDGLYIADEVTLHSFLYFPALFILSFI